MEHIASGSGEIAALFNQSSFLKPLLNVSSDELNEIIINMDSNQNNIITKDEFMTFMNAALERDQLDVLKQLFLMVDTQPAMYTPPPESVASHQRTRERRR